MIQNFMNVINENTFKSRSFYESGASYMMNIPPGWTSGQIRRRIVKCDLELWYLGGLGWIRGGLRVVLKYF